MADRIKCELFNLGNIDERRAYEMLLERKDDEKIAILDTDKAWGNKAEGTLFVYVVYRELGDY